MSIEKPKAFEQGPQLDIMHLVRDEMRSAVMLFTCKEAGADMDACFDNWAKNSNAEFENLFEEFSLEDHTFLDRWDDQNERAGIINRFADRITTTSFDSKKRAA